MKYLKKIKGYFKDNCLNGKGIIEDKNGNK